MMGKICTTGESLVPSGEVREWW